MGDRADSTERTMGVLSSLVALLSVVLPWPVRRRVLIRIGGWKIDPSASVGLSILAPRKSLVLGEGARIGHLNVIKDLDRVELGAFARIGSLNWITAIPTGPDDPYLDQHPDRRAELVLRDDASITSRHYIDCSDSVLLEPFAAMIGLRSTLLTHHVDVGTSKQSCAPIRVGERSMVATNCLILGGGRLPARSILGAGSTLLSAHDEELTLYAGSPAAAVKEYEGDLPWFGRSRTYRVR